MNDEAAARDPSELSTSDRGSMAPPRPAGTRLGAAPRPLPRAPRARAPRVLSPPRGPYALVALLSLLVVALAIGIFIVVRSPTEPLPAASAASPVGPPPAQVAPAEAGPAAGRPVEGPAAAAVGDAPALSIGEVEASPTPSRARAPSGRSTPRSSTRSASSARAGAAASSPRAAPPPPKAAAPEPPEPPPAEPRPPGKESCNPPYHFEGTKKIFKPACL